MTKNNSSWEDFNVITKNNGLFRLFIFQFFSCLKKYYENTFHSMLSFAVLCLSIFIFCFAENRY
jgi:hypothetical protein